MSKTLNIFTLVLDGMPYLSYHLPMLNMVNRGFIDWHWTIAEGAAMNVKDTSWCQPISPRLSRDGTTEYLNTIRSHPRVTILQRQKWNGKTEMVNACLDTFQNPGVLLQMDSDEIWSPHKLVRLVNFFADDPLLQSARFFCRYFVGQNIVITSIDAYGNKPGEWHRAWRYVPGLPFKQHEPPIYGGNTQPCASRERTKEAGMSFHHYAYALESQVRFKEEYYGYKDAVRHWRRLQENTIWPVTDLRAFLPWVGSGVTADLLHKL